MEIVKLSNGVEIPILGLGTYLSRGDELYQAVKSAIEIGYMSFDTAWIYENEQHVAKAIRESGRKREEFFMTSKLWNEFHGYDKTLKAFEISLNLLKTDYIDLYLIHWPGKDKFIDTWKAFEKLYKEKRIRAIGVSNFSPHHLEALMAESEVIPMVNQIETHPYLMDYKTIEYCRGKGILVEAYSPLGGAGSGLLNDEVLKSIGEKHGKSSAQVALRFLIQNGIRVLPKSVHADRQIQNIDVFDFTLNEEEMKAVKFLNKQKRFGADPDTFFEIYVDIFGDKGKQAG